MKVTRADVKCLQISYKSEITIEVKAKAGIRGTVLNAAVCCELGFGFTFTPYATCGPDKGVSSGSSLLGIFYLAARISLR